MKTARFFAMVLLAAASIPLIAQQPGAAESQKEVYTTQGPMGFGDASQSHAWEMSPVTCDLENKLDSKTAKVGDRVVLKTNDKVQTADGAVIPRGARLVGRVLQVQTQDATHNVAQLAIAIDRAELKNGQSIAIYTLIRGVHPRRNVSDTNPLADADPASYPATGSRGSRNGNAQTGVFSDEMQRVSPTTTSVADRAGTDTDRNPQEAMEFPGRGDPDETSAHRLAAARAVPRPTAIPGILLAGSSTASGVFLSRQRNIEIESGTEMQLGIIGQ